VECGTSRAAVAVNGAMDGLVVFSGSELNMPGLDGERAFHSWNHRPPAKSARCPCVPDVVTARLTVDRVMSAARTVSGISNASA
jgi:hypothetical protein